jgi:predicted ABC-type ATPase
MSKRSLEIEEPNSNKKLKLEKYALILMGIPGSGKTSLNNLILSTVKQNYNLSSNYNFEICNPDFEVKKIKKYTEREHFKFLKYGCIKTIEKFKNIILKEQSFIYDGTGVNLSTYKFMLKQCNLNNYKIILIKIDTSCDVAISRIQNRKRKVEKSIIETIHSKIDTRFKEYQKFTGNHLIINNNNDPKIIFNSL